MLHLELTRNNRIVKKVPKGTSEYQSSWILEENDDEHGEIDDQADEESTEEMMDDEMIADIKDDSSEETVCILMFCRAYMHKCTCL